MFVGLLLASGANHALIYKASGWWHPIKQTRVTIFHDVHVDTPDRKDTEKQHRDLKARTHSFKIVEDMRDSADEGTPTGYYILKSYDERNSEVHAGYEFTVHASPLLGLSKLPNSFNVECRRHYNFERFSAEKIKRDVRKTVQEISLYNDSPALNKFYKQIIANVAELNTKDSVSEFTLIAQTKGLIDARILHALYANDAHQSHIDIVVGGKHAETIEQFMPTLGYIEEERFGEKLLTTHDGKIQVPVISIASALAKTEFGTGTLIVGNTAKSINF
jgi:hypothetical protein